jgi:hypothetical protein
MTSLGSVGATKIFIAGRRSLDPNAGYFEEWWAVQDSNLRPPACKAGALTN